MDLVGNSTPQVLKLKLAGKPVDRHAAMLDYLQRTPQVRDVVVSGGDVANMPWKNLEGFLDKLLRIDNIRDIRLATKALMGLPQHWLQDDVVEGVARHEPVIVQQGDGLADRALRQAGPFGDVGDGAGAGQRPRRAVGGGRAVGGRGGGGGRGRL